MCIGFRELEWPNDQSVDHATAPYHLEFQIQQKLLNQHKMGSHNFNFTFCLHQSNKHAALDFFDE